MFLEVILVGRETASRKTAQMRRWLKSLRGKARKNETRFSAIHLSTSAVFHEAFSLLK